MDFNNIFQRIICAFAQNKTFNPLQLGDLEVLKKRNKSQFTNQRLKVTKNNFLSLFVFDVFLVFWSIEYHFIFSILVFAFSCIEILKWIHKAKCYSINMVLFYQWPYSSHSSFVVGYYSVWKEFFNSHLNMYVVVTSIHGCSFLTGAKSNRIGLSVTSAYKIESIKKGITWGISWFQKN